MFFPAGDMPGVAIELDVSTQTPTNNVTEISNAYKITFFILTSPDPF
jgi:hypothetical protein